MYRESQHKLSLIRFPTFWGLLWGFGVHSDEKKHLSSIEALSDKTLYVFCTFREAQLVLRIALSSCRLLRLACQLCFPIASFTHKSYIGGQGISTLRLSGRHQHRKAAWPTLMVASASGICCRDLLDVTDS